MNSNKKLPLLVVVSGAPASGKTTLAQKLSEELQLPLFSRDPIKETIADALPGDQSIEHSKQISGASFQILFKIVEILVKSNSNLIIETNFFRGKDESHFQNLIERARVVLIHCIVDPELSRTRFTQRHEQAKRHWSFLDEEHIRKFKAGIANQSWELAEPMDLDVPKLLVETNNGYKPDLEKIIDFITKSN